MLRSVVGNPVAAALGDRARREFLVRVGDLLAAEVDRRLAAINRLGVDSGLAARLREAGAMVAVVRHDAAATIEAA